MTENKGILRTGMFYIDHLDPNSKSDLLDINGFTIDAPEGQGLSVYLKEYSCEEELERNMRTYLVRDIVSDECVGYFSLKAGLISLNEIETEIEDAETGEHKTIREFDTLPGVELANFAVNRQLHQKLSVSEGRRPCNLYRVYHTHDRGSREVRRDQNGVHIRAAL